MTETLDYVRPTPWYKKRANRRALFWLFIAILLALIVKFTPAVWRRLSILYHQDLCMNHLDDPAAIAAAVSLDNQPSGAPAVDCKNFLDAVGPAASATYTYTTPSGSFTVPVSREGRIFLHARTSKGGTRLVTMDLDVIKDPASILIAGDPMSNVAFCVSVIKPATLLEDPQFLSDKRCEIFIGGDVPPNHAPSRDALVIRAGQPDEKDPAAFSVRFLFYGSLYIAKFRLSDDASQIEYLSMLPAKSQGAF